MGLIKNTKVIDGKKIRYFVNENGANIEIVKVEPNSFGDWWAYSTIDVYINIYNDDFSRQASFYVEGFNTGVTGESWFDDEEDDEDDVTEENAWERTLDYFSPNDPYDTWLNETDFLNSFNKYNEDLDEEPELMFDSMINDDELKRWCSTRFSEEDRAVFDFEIIKPEEDFN